MSLFAMKKIIIINKQTFLYGSYSISTVFACKLLLNGEEMGERWSNAIRLALQRVKLGVVGDSVTSLGQEYGLERTQK